MNKISKKEVTNQKQPKSKQKLKFYFFTEQTISATTTKASVQPPIIAVNNVSRSHVLFGATFMGADFP